MQMNFSMAEEPGQVTKIKVVGVGGAGGNAINRMVQSGMKGVEFISMNTDYQVLSTSLAATKVNIGVRLTKGQGCGGDATVGQRAAEESKEEIESVLKGADMVFITAGMGGGTGTGAAPVVAEIAQGMGILTVGVVTKPFNFEGKPRMERADMGIIKLKDHVDSIIVIPNERLRQVSTEPITLLNAFQVADEVLTQGVQSINDIINKHGQINLDFADVTSIMKGAGYAHMGVGRAEGKDKATLAATAAINSPLLETSIDGALGVIVNLTVSNDALLDDAYVATEIVRAKAHPDVNLIWGFAYDENLKDEMIVTVIATGFNKVKDPASNYKFKESDKETEDLVKENQTKEQQEQKSVEDIMDKFFKNDYSSSYEGEKVEEPSHIAEEPVEEQPRHSAFDFDKYLSGEDDSEEEKKEETSSVLDDDDLGGIMESINRVLNKRR